MTDFAPLLALLDRVGVPRTIEVGNDTLRFAYERRTVLSIEQWSRRWDPTRNVFFWATCKETWPIWDPELGRELLDALETLDLATEEAPKQTFEDGHQLMLRLDWVQNRYVLERLHEAFY